MSAQVVLDRWRPMLGVVGTQRVFHLRRSSARSMLAGRWVSTVPSPALWLTPPSHRRAPADDIASPGLPRAR